MARQAYTDEHIEYLKAITPGRYNDEITKMFNEKFGTNKTETAIQTVRQRNGIKSTVPKVKTQYTSEQLDYLRKLCDEGLFNNEITRRFNERFGTNKTERAIKSIRGKYKINTSARNQWEKGHTPWNKGLKGYMGPNETSFKKGEIPPNYLPVGSERVTADGYIEIKIEDPNVWKGKHILIWEKHNGPVPEGHCIIFGDGDRQNLDIGNLICVSRGQLLKLNQHGLIKNDADLTRTGVMIVDLQSKINERKKE